MAQVQEVYFNNSTKLSRIGNVMILTMLNGENKFNPNFMNDLNSALDYVEKLSIFTIGKILEITLGDYKYRRFYARCQDEIALVTTGSQEKYYSTGLDIPYLMSIGQDNKALNDFMIQFQTLIARLLTFPGAAFFALAHDYRVMRQDRGFFCLPEIDLKLAVPPGLMALLKAKVSDATYVRELILFGNKVGGVEAHKMAVVDAAVSASQVLVESAKIGQSLASKHKSTLKSLKIELYASAYKSLMAAEFGEAEKNFHVTSKL